VAKYAVFFSLTSDTLARFLENPSDRRGPVTKLVEAADGRLDSYYWMFGQHDGFVVCDLPNSAAAAAISLAVSSTGAFKAVETHELIEAGDLTAVAQKAKALKGVYTPPGQAR
jgi:uncharacterized protein with GYD domain